MAVHDVHVDGARPATLHGGDVVGEAREIGGQDRRGQDHGAALLTSRLTAACGVTRYPGGRGLPQDDALLYRDTAGSN